MTKEQLFQIMKGTVIVSCQATPGEPLYVKDGTVMHLMARAAKLAGATMIRTSSVRDILAIREETGLPVIGLIKRHYPGYEPYITPTLREVRECLEAGADIVSIDCTDTVRGDGRTPAEFLRLVRESFPNAVLMADCATAPEAAAAYAAGADLVATTMNGYTATTARDRSAGPNMALVREMLTAVPCPVIAEGRVHTPEQARAMLEAGAWAVVVGGAITRPYEIACRFMQAAQEASE